MILAITALRVVAHGVPTPIPSGPLHIQGTVIVDAAGQVIPLRGAEMLDLGVASPVSFGVLRLHWNFNTVRLKVSSATWQRDGQAYLDQVGGIVKIANDAGLIAVLANFAETGLPDANTIAFWKAWAAYFKTAPHVIFDVFNEPSVQNVPGRAANWTFWRDGDTGSDGKSYVGAQAVVDAIRSTGATQLIAVSSFNDGRDFQGFTSEFLLRDPNIIYEVHPFYDHALSDDDRDRNFGFLSRIAPVYAGAWGLDLTNDTPACRSVPANPQQATDVLFQTLAYFDRLAISWTAASFDPNSLIRSVSEFNPTQLNAAWTCGVVTNPQPGMGEILLLWLTGDPTGFGAILPELIASAAGGPTGPFAPGEIVKFFGFLFGPPDNAGAAFDTAGNLPRSLGGIQVTFDDEASPLFAVGPFEVTAQVPYSAAGKNQVNVRMSYNGVPTSAIILRIVETAPRIVTALGSNEALAINQDGAVNSSGNPAQSGSVISVFVTGHGQTSPPGVTGRAAQPPFAAPVASVSAGIGGAAAELLYMAEAPGLVGLLQLNVRIPGSSGARARAVPVIVTVGNQPSLTGVTIWVL